TMKDAAREAWRLAVEYQDQAAKLGEPPARSLPNRRSMSGAAVACPLCLTTENVHARGVPARGSIRPGLSVAEQRGVSSRDDPAGSRGRREPILIFMQQSPLQRNLSKVSRRDDNGTS